RNPDGTFQVIIQGQEKTRTERDIAYMTGLKKPELYEMLGKATKGRLQGEVSNVKYLPGNGVELLPKTENSSFYKTDRTAESRSAADRASENRSLLDARPPRRHPPSDHMHLLITDAHGLAIQKAMILVDHAHDDGELSPVRVSHRVDHSGALGAYRWAHGIYWAEIGVSRDTAYPLMTTVHEIGHHIRLHLDPNEVAKVAAVARQSEAAATCINFGMDVDYWLSDSELFSRIYAQWVIKRSNEGEAARELDSILNGADFWQQFGNADWRLIQPVMDSLMKKKGWL
ncbi:hypothetical protein, partial [Prosthecobacter fusiformis]|uniref:hypothetical protein n=1 Tax=Prosthecobacter fusiformis TaxID=48464 RepID=UPI0014150C30